MRLVVAGRPDEITGFALAGVETVVCRTPDAAEALIAGLCAGAAGVGLLILTPWIANHAPRAMAAARVRRGPPVVAIVPDARSIGG